MMKSIRNVVSAVKDMAAIAGKEVVYQATKVSSTTNSVTGKLAAKATNIREAYEVSLASRKESIDGELVIVRKHEHDEA